MKLRTKRFRQSARLRPLIFLGTFLAVISFIVYKVKAATNVSANITTNTTWNAAGSPYNFTGSYSVTNGATLTIDTSGGAVVVNFCNGCYLSVTSGTTVNANGTSGNMVTFKHTSTTTANAWEGIRVNTGGTFNATYSNFNYANIALRAMGGTLSVSDSVFSTNYYGLAVHDLGSLTTARNTFNKQTYVPLDLSQTTTISLGSGADADILGTGTDKNGYNGIGVGWVDGTFNNCVSDTCSLPQRAFGGISNISYIAKNIGISGSNDTLVIDAGVIVKFYAGSYWTISSGAKIDVNGTVGSPVYFTSYRDDTVGGDTNNDSTATSPAVDNWEGHRWNSGANTVDYLVMKYSSWSGITLQNSTTSLTINDSVYESNRGPIVVGNNASLTTARNTFNKNIYTPVDVSPENTSVTFGTGADADILGTTTNKNGYNAIGIGIIDSDANNCLSDVCTIPQRTFAGIANIPYLSEDIGFSGSNDTLVIDAGVIIKFNGYWTISSGAKIDVNGTVGSPVYFTSYRDDTVGGDTNNDSTATSPAVDNWEGHRWNSGANTVDYLVMKYSSWSGIRLSNSTTSLTINDSVYESNRGPITVMDNASLTTARNTFNKNIYAPVEISPENTSVTLGTGGNADILGTGADKNGYNALGMGIGDQSFTACPSDICTIPQRTFAGIANIPYIALSLSISGSNDTLVIDAGVIIKFTSGAYWTISSGAKIDVNGTVGSPVYFTSYRDDTVGGDTNNDSTATSPAVANWEGHRIYSGANTIDYLVMRYSGSIGALLQNSGTSLTINDSIYESNNFPLTVGNLASLTTARNTFNKNTYTPIDINPEHTSVTLGTGANADILGTGADKNGYNAIGAGVSDTDSTNCLSDVCTIPQRTFAGISNIPYAVRGLSFSGSNDTLVVDAGVIVKFIPSSSLTINSGAKIDVNGTLANPVYLTSYRDDSIGGDTNNDASATSPALSNWGGISLQGAGAHTLDFVKLRYSNNGLTFSGTNSTITDCDISYNQNGLYFNGTTSPTLSRVNIENNGTLQSGEYRWGAFHNSGSLMTITNLFWGDDSGPNDADAGGSCGTNVSTGNAVKDTAASPADYCPYSAVRFNTITDSAQYQIDGTTLIPTGGTSTDSSMKVQLNVGSFTSSTTLTAEIEALPVGSNFTNTATHTGSIVYAGTAVTGQIDLTGLTNPESYHWQYRVCDNGGICSAWTSYGSNLEDDTDFAVLMSVPVHLNSGGRFYSGVTLF